MLNDRLTKGTYLLDGNFYKLANCYNRDILVIDKNNNITIIDECELLDTNEIYHKFYVDNISHYDIYR